MSETQTDTSESADAVNDPPKQDTTPAPMEASESKDPTPAPVEPPRDQPADTGGEGSDSKSAVPGAAEPQSETPQASKPEANRRRRPSKDQSAKGKDQPEGDTDQGPRQDDAAKSEGESGDRNQEGSRRGKGRQRNRRTRKSRQEQREKEREREAAILEAAPAVELEGLIEVSPKGFGFLRQKKRNFQQSPEDVFITPEIVRVHGLRDGVWVKCLSKEGVRGPQLIEVLEINGREPEAYHNLPYFEELTAINPNKRLAIETKSDRSTTRVIDLMTPIGRGQRGLIVAPPRTGKTTLLHHIAEGIQENYEEEHLIIMLIDERPEEVTHFQRSFPDVDIFASSNDSDVKSHTRMAQLAIERAKRLVEAGENVFILLDSITRLARAFNNSVSGGKKRGTQSGGIAVGALEIPRKLFAAARNTREAGALTIIGTALIQTNSRMDEAIFQEFKGTGNMELVLDRQLAQNYVYPAIDIHKSGTRREELLLPAHQLEKIHVIRRGLAGYKPMEAMEWLLNALGKYPNNAQMLMDIKVSAVA